MVFVQYGHKVKCSNKIMTVSVVGILMKKKHLKFNQVLALWNIILLLYTIKMLG